MRSDLDGILRERGLAGLVVLAHDRYSPAMYWCTGQKIHHGLYAEALKAVQSGGDMPARAVYVCPICGNTVYDGAPHRCPICNCPGKEFVEIS